jgi:ppGpp synthetase/RelA/SpoT-type nucleotidyltranferase
MSTQQSEILPFQYEEYSGWFDDHAKGFLSPAQKAATQALNELLDRELLEPQRVRIRVEPGRVKTKARTWKKLNDKYAKQVRSTADIPSLVDDLVGLRVVCTNKSDASRFVEILDSLDEYADGDDPVLATCPETARDWVTAPKPSGYRAHHINLCTSVPRATERHVVVCELQIRTLLQDSWGELTHEDTYKPGGEVPPLVDTLSRRMADLMATLDDLAEDLRSELDRLAEDSLTDGPKGSGPSASPNRDAACEYLADRIADLSRPTALGSLAWELQREFGQEIINGWFGSGTFKGLLKSAVPDVRLSPNPPSYVLPAGFDVESYSQIHSDLPRAASLLKAADRSFPLVSEEHWPKLYAALAGATHEVSWEGDADIRMVNELTRAARDASQQPGADRVTRQQVSYVANGLMFGRTLKMKMSPSEVERKFVEWTLSRARDLDVPGGDLEELETWLRGPSAEG